MRLSKEDCINQVKQSAKKMQIIRKYRIIPKPFVYDILDELWDDNQNFIPEKTHEIVDKIKMHQKQVIRANRYIEENAIKDMESFGLVREQDYDIEFTSTAKGGKRAEYISLTFRLKSNKKIIELFSSKGWVIDRKYKNEDGDPSMYSSDYLHKNMVFKVVMVVMEYVVEDLYLDDLGLQ